MLRAIILIVAFVAVKGDGCAQRSYGEGSVCVCNATYCDTMEMPLLQKDQYLSYRSVKGGKMMEFSINTFSTETESSKENCSSIILTLDSNKKYQQTCGFGGALTDAAAINIRSLSNATQHRLLESYFGKTGIGYTLARIPIAGTDFSTRAYTYDDEPGDVKLSQFKLAQEDDYKIQYLEHIKRIMRNSSDLRIFTTSWSAPPWMKNTNNIKWGYLKKEYYQIYADYILKFFDAYKERGIDIWAMTPGNEPIDGLIPGFPFNSMAWPPYDAANFTVNYLAPTLSKAGYKDLVYIAMDDQRFMLPFYPATMFENEEAKKLFSGIAVHWYVDRLFPASLLIKTHDMFPDKFLLMSEACTGTFVTNLFEPNVVLGSWERGEQYMKDIIENLRNMVCGWVDWNMALNMEGGPNWVANYVDSPIIVNSETDEFYKQPMFYALSHFASYVPRGSYVISSTEENCLSKKFYHAAFVTPENKNVIVMVNTNDETIPVTIKTTNSNTLIKTNLVGKSFHSILYTP